jgi:hypothetical protein
MNHSDSVSRRRDGNRERITGYCTDISVELTLDRNRPRCEPMTGTALEN